MEPKVPEDIYKTHLENSSKKLFYIPSLLGLWYHTA